MHTTGWHDRIYTTCICQFAHEYYTTSAGLNEGKLFVVVVYKKKMRQGIQRHTVTAGKRCLSEKGKYLTLAETVSGRDQLRERLLPYHQAVTAFQQPFILSGYRPSLSPRECVASIFSWHNETINIWTHAVPTVLFVLWMLYLQLSGSVDFVRDSYSCPLLALFIGVIFCSLFSSLAHMFHCISQDIGYICYYFDYIGIAFLGLVQTIANYHYSRPEGLPFYDWSLPYIISIEVVACAVGSYVYCASQHQNLMQLRTAFALFVYITGIIPLLQRVWYAQQWEFETTVHLIHITLTFMGLVVYALHVPERIWPGCFDYVGHSHGIFHVLISGSMLVHIYAALTDMVTRRELLGGGKETMVSDVFWPVRTLSAAQTVVIGIFVYRLWKKGK